MPSSKSEQDTHCVSDEFDGIRFDRWLRKHFPHIPLSLLYRLLRQGEIRLDGRRAQGSARLLSGQKIVLPSHHRIGDKPTRAPIDAKIQRDLECRVLYRDDDVLIIDKPAGLAVQGGSGVTRSLDDYLDALRFDSSERPRLVHRLDRQTSGVLILARRRRSAVALAELFRHRHVSKTYWALVIGDLEPPAGRIDRALIRSSSHGQQVRQATGDGDGEGKEAVTNYLTLARSGGCSWLAIEPLTGRMHQIRVHLAAAGHPLIGDSRYGLARGRGEGVLCLHAQAVAFCYPDNSQRRIDIEAPLPEALRDCWKSYGFVLDIVR